MNKTRAVITSVGGYVPEYVLTNKELERMVETDDEWIRTRTGIEERRILKGEAKGVSELALPAAREALEKRGMDPAELDLIIVGTVTGDMVFPDTGTWLCHLLGAHNAFAFDLNAACSGFVYSLWTGAQFIESGRYRNVLVIGADKMSSIVDYEDRTTCILFGDGAGAVLLEAGHEGLGILDAVVGGDGSGREFLRMRAGGSIYPATHETVEAREHFVFQDGRPVFKAAVHGMKQSVKTVMERNGLSNDDVDWIVPHQANLRIINSVADFLEVPMDKVMVNINRYGNTTSGTIPLCLWEWEPRLKTGDNIILTAFGAGYTWGAVYVKWAYDGLRVGR